MDSLITHNNWVRVVRSSIRVGKGVNEWYNYCVAVGTESYLMEALIPELVEFRKMCFFFSLYFFEIPHL